MRLVLVLAAVLFGCLLFAGASFGQCANGQCGVSQGYQSYSYAPYSTQSTQGFSAQSGAVTYEQRPVYGPFGRFRGYETVAIPAQYDAMPTQAIQSAKVSSSVGHPCACGCDLTGQCVCKSCNVGCGFPAQQADKTQTNPLAVAAPVAPKLREVSVPDGYVLAQDDYGTLYIVKKGTIGTAASIQPSGGWKWVANEK